MAEMKRAGMRARLLAVAVAAVVTSACTTGSSNGGQTPGSATTTPSAQPVTTPSPSPSPEVGLSLGFVRGCGSEVLGDLGKHPTTGAVVAGPIMFVGLVGARDLLPKDLVAAGGGHYSVKVLVVVKQGWRAAVSVPPPQRTKARLLYDPSVFPSGPPYKLRQGESIVTFASCTGGGTSWADATQFNGGIIVTGPLCLHLRIETSGPVPESRSISAPIAGGASCPLHA
jgi:hypothetical protein